jgi:hypothetical protein
LAFLLGSNIAACAQEDESIEDTVDVSSSQRLLIINSYNEQSAWSQHVMSEVIKQVSMENNIFVSTCNMHDTGMANDTVYNMVADNIFKRYHSKHPQYVVFIGNLAFTLRDPHDRVERRGFRGAHPILLYRLLQRPRRGRADADEGPAQGL